MGPLVIAGFAVWCLCSLASAPLAVSLVVSFFPLEQLMQASGGIFRETYFGLKPTNIIVGLTAIFSTIYAVSRNPERFRGFMNPIFLLVASMYVWTLATCVWSPGGKRGFDAYLLATPYLSEGAVWVIATTGYVGAAILSGVVLAHLVERPSLRMRDRLFPSLAPGGLTTVRTASATTIQRLCPQVSRSFGLESLLCPRILCPLHFAA